MRYMLLLLMLIFFVRPSVACSPALPSRMPGESQIEAYERNERERKIELIKDIKEKVDYVTPMADSIFIGKVTEKKRVTPIWHRARSFFSRTFNDGEYDYEYGYLDTMKLKITPIYAIKENSIGNNKLNLQLSGDGFSCFALYITRFEDDNGEIKSISIKGDSYKVGEEYIFYVKNNKLMYSVIKTLYKDVGIDISKRYDFYKK